VVQSDHKIFIFAVLLLNIRVQQQYLPSLRRPMSLPAAVSLVPEDPPSGPRYMTDSSRAVVANVLESIV
jgi:hypothetical protein